MLVICDHVGRIEYCKVCPHGKPHVPEVDEPFYGEKKQCNLARISCGGGEEAQDAWIMCIPVKKKSQTPCRQVGLPIWSEAK
jgi:hypothetical protein